MMSVLNIKLSKCCLIFIVSLFIAGKVNCNVSKWNRNLRSNTSIGFEHFNHHNNHTSKQHVETTQRPDIGFERFNQYNNSSSRPQPVTTRKPETRPTFKPHPRPTLQPKPSSTKHTTRKPHSTTTRKPPARPTLPPFVHKQHNISQVILPYVKNGITTGPYKIQDKENQNNFNVFLNYLDRKTYEAKKTNRIRYLPPKGDHYKYYYEAYNYYHQPQKIAQYFTVPADKLMICRSETTKIMCFPETSSLCMRNGTILCVTHLINTIPCEMYGLSCAITKVTCDPRRETCTNTKPMKIGVPCVSKITVLPSTDDYYKQVTSAPVEFCVTNFVEPQKLYSGVGDFINMFMEIGKKNYNGIKNAVYPPPTVNG